MTTMIRYTRTTPAGFPAPLPDTPTLWAVRPDGTPAAEVTRRRSTVAMRGYAYRIRFYPANGGPAIGARSAPTLTAAKAVIADTLAPMETP